MIKKIFKVIISQERFSLYSSLLTAIFTTTLSLIFLINYPKLPSELPLFYSLVWGEVQLASRDQFIILPLVVILITMINGILAWHLHPSQLLLKRIVSLSTALVALLILITSLRVIYIFI